MARDTTIINKFGVLTGWNKITWNWFGRDVVGIDKIEYDDEIPFDLAYGQGQMPIGEIEGNYKPTCSISLYEEELRAMEEKLPSGVRIQDVSSTATIAYLHNGRVWKDTLHNVRITKRGVSVKQGDGKMVTTPDIHLVQIKWNQ